MTIGLAIDILLWLAVLVGVLPSFVRVVSGRGSSHDPLFVGFFVIAAIMLAYSIRWLIARDSAFALEVLRWLNAAVPIYVLLLIRFYRRV